MTTRDTHEPDDELKVNSTRIWTQYTSVLLTATTLQDNDTLHQYLRTCSSSSSSSQVGGLYITVHQRCYLDLPWLTAPAHQSTMPRPCPLHAPRPGRCPAARQPVIHTVSGDMIRWVTSAPASAAHPTMRHHDVTAVNASPWFTSNNWGGGYWVQRQRAEGAVVKVPWDAPLIIGN